MMNLQEPMLFLNALFFCSLALNLRRLAPVKPAVILGDRLFRFRVKFLGSYILPRYMIAFGNF